MTVESLKWIDDRKGLKALLNAAGDDECNAVGLRYCVKPGKAQRGALHFHRFREELQQREQAVYLKYSCKLRLLYANVLLVLLYGSSYRLHEFGTCHRVLWPNVLYRCVLVTLY